MSEANIFGAKVKMRPPGELTAAERETGRRAMIDWNTRLLMGAIANAQASRYLFGLSVGQVMDFSALAILEEQQREQTSDPKVLHCRHLQRWTLRTPYEQIGTDTAKLLNRQEVRSEGRNILAIDATGVGLPVVNLFKQAKINANIKPCLLTGGDEVTDEGEFTRIPKRDLVSTAQIAFQSGRLKIAEGLEHTQQLVSELTSFQTKVVLSAGPVETAWREGKNDDLVLAVMVALWQSQQHKRELFSVGKV